MKTLVASLLTAAALAALLVGWFSTGWRSVAGEARAMRAAPRTEAEATALTLAGELAARLEALRAGEDARPYFQYQNLYHDPRGASTGLSVLPSPLAAGPADELIAAHFQIDGAGQVTLPTINEEIQELSNFGRPGDRDLLALLRSAGSDLTAPQQQTVVASVTPVTAAQATAAPPRRTTQRAGGVQIEHEAETATATSAGGFGTQQATAVQVASAAPPAAGNAAIVQEQAVEIAQQQAAGAYPQQQAPAKVLELDPSVYSQNAAPNMIYQELQTKADGNTKVQQKSAPTAQPAPAAPPLSTAPLPSARMSSPRFADDERPAAPATQPAPSAGSKPTPTRGRAPRVVPAAPPASITIVTEPFLWRSIELADTPRLAALRRVETPDGALTQGFLIAPESASAWLAERTGAEAPVALAAGKVDGDLVSAVLPVGNGAWSITVDPRPALAVADAAAGEVGTRFLRQFIPLALIALLCGGLVVWVVARAERTARQRASFAAAAAHELRTPLAGLQLYGDMLAEGLGNPARARDYARQLSDEAARLGRVVGNVLGFTQLERGALDVRAQPRDLIPALTAILERMRPAIEHHGATLAIELPRELPARFDEDALARIVQNLIDNAEKYGRDASDRAIQVSARAMAAGGVEIAVADRGPGISRRVARKLFRPFQRGAPPDGPAGLGLGLALSRALARAQGGELALGPARAGGGATFVLTLAA